mmetsp:Transcript_21913/g.52648  ORF Transcript_21913/g.52648 Transcript_21913/m.52648 type:complete len:217 (+) Transcript_21913:10-660(+)
MVSRRRFLSVRASRFCPLSAAMARRRSDPPRRSERMAIAVSTWFSASECLFSWDSADDTFKCTSATSMSTSSDPPPVGAGPLRRIAAASGCSASVARAFCSTRSAFWGCPTRRRRHPRLLYVSAVNARCPARSPSTSFCASSRFLCAAGISPRASAMRPRWLYSRTKSSHAVRKSRFACWIAAACIVGDRCDDGGPSSPPLTSYRESLPGDGAAAM